MQGYGDARECAQSFFDIHADARVLLLGQREGFLDLFGHGKICWSVLRLDISHELARRLRPLSLTPCFSWVKSGFVRLRTVSTVSTGCSKPLKRFFRW